MFDDINYMWKEITSEMAGIRNVMNCCLFEGEADDICLMASTASVAVLVIIYLMLTGRLHLSICQTSKNLYLTVSKSMLNVKEFATAIPLLWHLDFMDLVELLPRCGEYGHRHLLRLMPDL